MEIQRKRYEAINLKWKIAEIDEAQKQLDIMLKSGLEDEAKYYFMQKNNGGGLPTDR